MIHRLATFSEILPLRHEILRPQVPREEAIFAGDENPSTLHFAAVEQGRIVGCLTMMLQPLDGHAAWQLRGMAVAADCQGNGVGRDLLQFALDQLREKSDIDLIWCNARTVAKGFYEKLGWRIISQEFPIAGVGPHFRMSRTL